jgi:hypothetical protein
MRCEDTEKPLFRLKLGDWKAVILSLSKDLSPLFRQPQVGDEKGELRYEI